MLKTPTMEKLKAMKLLGMASALEEQQQSKSYGQLSFDERLGHMIDCEQTLRDNKRLSNRLRQAKLRQSACIEDIDFKVSRGIDKSMVLDLARCKWIKEHRNVIVTGLTGVGKSYLACALAHRACLEGFTSLYVRAPRFFNELLMAKADGRYMKVLTQIAKLDLLVIDDWGLNKLSDQEEKELMEVMEDRYELKSTIVTSQVPVKDWHQLIPNPTIADAILDRLVHNSYRIELKGESLRKDEKKTKGKNCRDEK